MDKLENCKRRGMAKLRRLLSKPGGAEAAVKRALAPDGDTDLQLAILEVVLGPPRETVNDE
jgi:hypothetical protein